MQGSQPLAPYQPMALSWESCLIGGLCDESGGYVTGGLWYIGTFVGGSSVVKGGSDMMKRLLCDGRTNVWGAFDV